MPSCSKQCSLMSSLVVKMLTVLVTTISNLQVFLLKKCELLAFFQQKVSMYLPYFKIEILMPK